MDVEQKGGEKGTLKKIAFILSILLSLVISTNVKAANLTDEEYNRLRIVFSDARIALMSDEDADRYLSYDLEGTQRVSKYYKVTDTTNGTITTEVSEEEATAAANAATLNNGIMPAAASYTTSYKNIQILRTSTGNNYYLMYLINDWLIEPSTKSYDVIAMRVDDATMVAGTQSGIQMYMVNGTSGSVNYSYQGTNMVLSSNGFGISMNLVDAADEFTCEIEAIVQATTEWATVYGSYQHAVRNVTLAQSKSYTISHNGYGKVVNFATGIQNTYDEMKGVSISLDYTA